MDWPREDRDYTVAAIIVGHAERNPAKSSPVNHLGHLHYPAQSAPNWFDLIDAAGRIATVG
ncbi:hypothetical protein EAH80_12245 [Mycobacterium hodleri]|uniref:Uncharacterized protein n=1 Tax=Mycolicibacterium hodleri TaxID=49897 RepID=A0A502ED00_9MYCO|nr:hypothetical protein EAH80_12245 [Mycolicibacterium hodleri]